MEMKIWSGLTIDKKKRKNDGLKGDDIAQVFESFSVILGQT